MSAVRIAFLLLLILLIKPCVFFDLKMYVGEMARKAVDIGVAGIVVSNHGGRQLDGTPATVSLLLNTNCTFSNNII